jgi:spermidine synthase
MNKQTAALAKHLLVEYYECNTDKIRDADYIEKSMLEAAQVTGVKISDCIIHSFAPWGVSGAVVMGESHLTIHTWGEFNFASVDLYTTGENADPWQEFNYLAKALESKNFSVMEFKRGVRNLLPSLSPEELPKEPFKVSERLSWYHDLDPYGFGVCIQTTGGCLMKKQSKFQKLEVYDTKKYGKMLVQDGKVQITERDEFVQHELMVHVPFLTHPNAKRVLIVSGGDGGVVREVLKHENVEKVVLLEADPAVIETSKQFFPQLASALDDSRVEVRIEDGSEYLKEAGQESFDIIFIDSADIGSSVTVFDDGFYKNCLRVLSEDGILISQSASPSGAPNEFKDIYKKYYSLFGNEKVHCFSVETPCSSTGLWSFSYCSKGSVHPLKNLNEKKADDFSLRQDLKYYNPEMHKAVFAVPNYVRDMLFGLKFEDIS